MSAPKEFEVFYDGDCPLCLREINMLKRMDKRCKIEFTNIADPNFKAEELGIPYSDLMAEIYGRLPDGTFVKGVEVFRHLYSSVGFSWVVAPTRLPGISHLLDFGYKVFAKNRLRLTGRCNANGCQTGIDSESQSQSAV